MKYFFENEKNEQVGPVDIEKLKEANIKSTSLIWKEGMENWSQAKNFVELNHLFVKPPPLPKKSNKNHINNKLDTNDIQSTKNSFWSTKGRVTRSTYFGYAFIYGGILFFLTKITENLDQDSTMLLLGLLAIPVLYLYIVLVIKRLHDMNFYGWLFLVTVIPPINLILLVWDGIEGPNKYGADPKGRKSRS